MIVFDSHGISLPLVADGTANIKRETYKIDNTLQYSNSTINGVEVSLGFKTSLMTSRGVGRHFDSTTHITMAVYYVDDSGEHKYLNTYDVRVLVVIMDYEGKEFKPETSIMSMGQQMVPSIKGFKEVFDIDTDEELVKFLKIFRTVTITCRLHAEIFNNVPFLGSPTEKIVIDFPTLPEQDTKEYYVDIITTVSQ